MSKEWRLNVTKMLVISYLIYKANVIAVKLPVSYFSHIYSLILQCILKDKTPRTNNTIENKKKKVRDLYKVTITNAVWYWQKNRHINEMDPHTLLVRMWIGARDTGSISALGISPREKNGNLLQ